MWFTKARFASVVHGLLKVRNQCVKLKKIIIEMSLEGGHHVCGCENINISIQFIFSNDTWTM